ncbi:MAG: hypothetical protein KY445_07800 [Armatimonadetes bacterium]|nr:hypothetical protein [Armatimonadota bacterium]
MNAQQQLEAQIQAVTSTITRIVTALAGVLVSLPLLGGAIASVVGIIGGFGLAIRAATSEASALARSLSQMRTANGYSFGQGYDIQRRFSAIGVSQSDTAGLFSQSGNSAFGFAMRGVNPLDLASQAARYQSTAASGIFGSQLANARVNQDYGGAANVPAALREALANLSPDQIRGQQAYSDRINGALGVNPNVLKEYVSGLSLLQARISTTIDAMKVKLGVELLPLVTRVFGAVSDYLVSNAGKIGDTIHRVAEWIMMLPAHLMRFGAQVLRAFAWLLDGLGAFLHTLADNIPAIAGLFDAAGNAFVDFVNVLSGVVSSVLQIGANLKDKWKELPESVRKPIEAAADNPNAIPIAIGAYILRNPIVKGIGALARGALGLFGGGAAAAATTTAAGGATATGATGIAAAFGAAPVAIGTAIGVGGTELLRRFRVAIGDKAAPESFGELLSNVGRRLGIIGDPATSTHAIVGEPLKNNGDPMGDPMDDFMPVNERGAMDAFAAGRKRFSRTNIADNPDLLAAVSRALGNGGDKAKSGAETLKDWAGTLDKGADNWSGEIRDILKSIEQRAAGTEKNTSKGERVDDLRALSDLILRFGARVAAEISEDNALNVLRI